MPFCPQHNTELRWRDGGISNKTGKPYNGFFSCPTRNADGSFCSFKAPTSQPPTKPQQFAAGLDADVAKAVAMKKDDTISRLAIIKELIGQGRKYDVDTVKEFYRWLDLANGKETPVEPTYGSEQGHGSPALS